MNSTSTDAVHLVQLKRSQIDLISDLLRYDIARKFDEITPPDTPQVVLLNHLDTIVEHTDTMRLPSPTGRGAQRIDLLLAAIIRDFDSCPRPRELAALMFTTPEIFRARMTIGGRAGWIAAEQYRAAWNYIAENGWPSDHPSWTKGT